MKKYGLQLRIPPSQPKKQPTRPPLPPPLGFGDENEDDIEREISRQASKNKTLKDVSKPETLSPDFISLMFLLFVFTFPHFVLQIEEQHKKALEEDPTVFDYDGVYEEMKEKTIRPMAQDREERKVPFVVLTNTPEMHN